MGAVFDIKRFAVHDGPGIRTTVFLKGCPLRCTLCHNPESQDPRADIMYTASRCRLCGACQAACSQGVIRRNGAGLVLDRGRCTRCGACAKACSTGAMQRVGRAMTVAAVMEEIERDVIFYDESGGGATFSGGEPLMQPEFLAALLDACRARDIRTAVDTCGCAPPEVIDALQGRADLFLYDLKVLDSARHERFTGQPSARIMENLVRLSAGGADVVVRVPLLPGINDDAENARAIGEFVGGLPRAHPVDLLPYHGMGAEKYRRLGRVVEHAAVKPPSRETIARVAGILASRVRDVRVRGEPYGHD